MVELFAGEAFLGERFSLQPALHTRNFLWRCGPPLVGRIPLFQKLSFWSLTVVVT